MSAEHGGDDVVQAKPIKKRDEIPAQKAELTRELLDLALMKMESGGQKAMDVLLGIFEQFPTVEDALIATSGDIPAAVESALLRTALPNHLLSHHLWSKRLDRMRAQLARPDQSPLETALISRIVTCYLAVNLAELEAATHKDGGRAV